MHYLILKKNNLATDSLSKFVVTYEVFIKSLINNTTSETLITILNDILSSKYAQCTKQQLDYKEFIDSFIKHKEILQKEIMWNIFKNSDKNNYDYLDINEILKILVSHNKKIEKDKIKEILKINNVKELETIDFDQFVILWNYPNY